MTDGPLQNPVDEAKSAAPSAGADASNARAMLMADETFLARLHGSNPFAVAAARQRWDEVNAAAAKAETEAAKVADDAQRDGSPQPALAFDVEAGDLLAGQSVDAEVLELGRGVAADLGLSAEEWSVLKISWSGAVANLDRGGPVMTAEDGIRELSRRHGIEGADAILNDARQFLRGISKDRAAEVEHLLTATGLGNSPVFAERIAAMHRARQGRKK